MTQAQASIPGVAAYFRCGLTLGLIDEREIRDWAYGLIEHLPLPPAEIIDVALSRDVKGLLSALSAVGADCSESVVGPWLLHRLKRCDLSTDAALHHAVGLAMRISRMAEMGEAVFHEFDSLDDGVSLARTKVQGSVASCREEFQALLSTWAEESPWPVAGARKPCSPNALGKPRA